MDEINIWTNVALSLITGIVSGAISSVLSWFYVTRIVAPRFEISSKIAKIRSAEFEGTFFYQFKIQNLSKRWRLNRVEVSLRLYVPDLSVKGTVSGFNIGPAIFLIPSIESRVGIIDGAYRYTVPHRSEETRRALDRRALVREVGSIPQGREFLLEQLLKKDGSYLRAQISATHSFFGSIKTVVQDFRIDDIMEGRFGRYDSEIRRYKSPTTSELHTPASDYYFPLKSSLDSETQANAAPSE